jgi:FlaA1/EpsC-like NDP-sugar epimerase
MRSISVRFGNVLGSNGSLVPILQQQLKNDQHLTVTHPDITRFFMTTREAVSLVLHAFSIGNHGDTLVLDMGSPIRIFDLAKKLIRLSGKSEQDVEIKFTGLRDGEKLFEELYYPSEKIHPTTSPKIWQVHGTPHRWPHFRSQLHQLRAAMSAMGAAAIRARIQEIVPEYSNLAEPSSAATSSSQQIPDAELVPSLLLRPARSLGEFSKTNIPRFLS